MDRSEMPLAELKLLAAIIERKENIRLRQRSFAITIVAGLGVARYSEKVGLTRGAFALIAGSVVLTFWVMETVYKNVEDRAIERSRRVEEVIRLSQTYDGPLIGESLAPPTTREQISFLIRHLLNPRISVSYVALGILVAIYAVVG